MTKLRIIGIQRLTNTLELLDSRGVVRYGKLPIKVSISKFKVGQLVQWEVRRG
jgi:hypothetical protein